MCGGYQDGFSVQVENGQVTIFEDGAPKITAPILVIVRLYHEVVGQHRAATERAAHLAKTRSWEVELPA